jgi:uncharacterized protein YdhG (YjbR/CyaY superfamily)
MDDYPDGLTPDQKAALALVRETVADLVPDADDGISYGPRGNRRRPRSSGNQARAGCGG